MFLSRDKVTGKSCSALAGTSSRAFPQARGAQRVRLTMVPLDATDAEVACFAGAMSGMDNGWGGGYKVLDELLAELQA